MAKFKLEHNTRVDDRHTRQKLCIAVQPDDGMLIVVDERSLRMSSASPKWHTRIGTIILEADEVQQLKAFFASI